MRLRPSPDRKPVEIQRLVVDEPQSTFTLDLHAGLTVAFHQDPALRSRCIAALLHALGPGSAGHHLELIDNDQRHLVVFRPRSGAAQVIDIDHEREVTEEFRTSDGVDLLSWVGVSQESAPDRLRLGAGAFEHGLHRGTEEHLLARRLAALDQGELWAAAEAVVISNARLAEAHSDLPGHDLAEVEALARRAELHDHSENRRREHRPVTRIGPVLTVICILIGLVLTAGRDRLGDNTFTATALFVLAAAAAAITVGDRCVVWRSARRERAAWASHGVTHVDRLTATVGPLADPCRREGLSEANEVKRTALAHWEAFTNAAPLPWALSTRERIEALAGRQLELHRRDVPPLAIEDRLTAVGAQMLLDRVHELRDLGPRRERVPLLLDDPFTGATPAEVRQLLETVHHLASYHQILLVTGDPHIQAWATQSPAAASVQFVPLGALPAIPRR